MLTHWIDTFVSFVPSQSSVKLSFDPSQYTTIFLVPFDEQILDKLTPIGISIAFVDKFFGSCVVFTLGLELLAMVQFSFVELHRTVEFVNVELTKLLFEVRDGGGVVPLDSVAAAVAVDAAFSRSRGTL